MTDEDRKAYADAVDIAMREYDALVPAMRRAQQLRTFIISGSNLIGKPVDDIYVYRAYPNRARK